MNTRATLKFVTVRVGSRTAAVGIGAIVVIVMLGLTGCTGSGFSVLDRSATPGDALPADLPDYVLVEPSSIRFAGRYDGDRLYVAKGTGSASHGGKSVCLLIYPKDGEGWTSVCGPSEVSVDNGIRKYVLHIDNEHVPNGAVQVSPNILVFE